MAISLERECNVIYSFGRKSLYNILNGGFCIETKDGEFFKKFNKTTCKIYELSITEEQYEEVIKIIKNMELNIDDYKYDFLGIVPRFLSIPIKFENKFVCSYFAAHVLEQANIYNFEKDTCMVIPRDFERLEDLNESSEIYTGSYLQYG